jgi:hypothetical protein
MREGLTYTTQLRKEAGPEEAKQKHKNGIKDDKTFYAF